MTHKALDDPRFGSHWTRTKLDIIESYLDAYTTALKFQPFQLFYIDGFAGTGHVRIKTDDSDGQKILRGSATRALTVTDRAFDHIILIEEDSGYCRELQRLREAYPGRDIQILNEDANLALQRLSTNWRGRRGVLFLDPFATQVDWTTVRAVADTGALDTWILFPVGAIRRLLPRWKTPDEVSRKWAARLNRVYGGPMWRQLYAEMPVLFGPRRSHSDRGIEGLLRIYRQRLRELVGARLLSTSARLGPPGRPPLFELLFFAGNARGIGISHDIAGYLIGTKRA